MSVTLWLDTPKEITIELGGTIPVYQAFGEMNRVARAVGGEDFFKDYPDLGGVLTQCEWQEDAPKDWMKDVRIQARNFLDKYHSKLSHISREILVQLRDEHAMHDEERG